jgi:pimeloyl-ACP methyl ester carboxylesterase
MINCRPPFLLGLLLVASLGVGCAPLGDVMYNMTMDGLAQELGLEERLLHVDGTPVAAYVRDGDDPLLLSHGITSNKEGWLNVAGALGDRGIVLPDLLGHGDTPPTDEPMSAAHQAEVLGGLLDELGIEQAHLVGMSMGGHITGELALQRPDLARSATFIASVGWQGAEPAEFDVALETGETSFDQPTREAVDAFWEWLVLEPPPDLPGPVLDYLVEERIARNDTYIQVFRDYEPTRFSIEDRLGDIDAPVNAIWCPADRMAHISAARELEDETGGRVILIEGCGHLPQLEQPEATGQALAEILEQLETAD